MGQLMMDRPLLISDLIVHAERFHGETEIISVDPSGGDVHTKWDFIAANARRLSNWLGRQNLTDQARVATLAWNTHRHLELYFAIPGSGRVCHTLNPRLHTDQLIYIINNAEVEILFFDVTMTDAVATVMDRLTTVKTFVAMCEHDEDIAAKIDGVLFYEDILQAEDDCFDWPVLDERSPAILCYTSGTTGKPKGVLYSHRSTVLHALACNNADGVGLRARDCLLPVVPMFHFNAWGTPFMAAAVGAALAMPGHKLDGDSLTGLINYANVTHALGVPTVWLDILETLNRTGRKIDSLKRSIVGGSAVPPSMISEFAYRYGVELIHGWGMTEMSPFGTINQPLRAHEDLDEEDMLHIRTAQGRPPFGVDLRIVDEAGNVLPNDGKTIGALQARGHWVVEEYFKEGNSACTDDGWFDTGDISTIDPDGFMRIQDRAKDIIKSGGEWISTVELENIAVSHPRVENAAAIAAHHPKWAERPIILVVANGNVEETALLKFFEGKTAKWQVPDRVIFVDDLPIGATGKVLKADLRKTYSNVLLT